MVSTTAEPLNAILEELRALSRNVDSHSRMVEARFAEMHAKIDALETSLPKEVRVQLVPQKKQRLEFNPPACPNDTDGECEESHRNPPSATPLVPHSHQHVAVEKKPLDAKPVPGENEELQEPHHNPPGVSALLPHSHQHVAADKKPSDTKPVPGEQINIRVRDAEGNIVQFKMKRSTALKKLMDAYCYRLGDHTNAYKYKFLFDCQRIADDDTPEILDMQDLDEIDVFFMQ